MKITLVAPALTSLFVLLAGCGQNAQESTVASEPPNREIEARSAPAAAQKRAIAQKPAVVAKSGAPGVDGDARKAHGDGDAEHCNCQHGACDVDEDDGDLQDVHVGSAPVRGSARAPVTIVVFTDFQCPFCAKAETTMHELSAKYGDRVRVAFKNNPLPFHDDARLASRAGLAAAEQGKFWEYHDALFAHQDALGRDALLGYAKGVGLDVAKFTAAMDAERTATAVDADIAEAKKLSVMGTPAFFVNGRRLVGAQPLAKFEALVDEALLATR